jgi:hypothetical protein
MKQLKQQFKQETGASAIIDPEYIIWLEKKLSDSSGVMEEVNNDKLASNAQGGLHIMELKGKYYWLIFNYDTDFNDIDYWQEVPESLYREIKDFNDC